MPKSHDAKPRNWHRRNKAHLGVHGHPIGHPKPSRRGLLKQVLSFRAKEAAFVQIAVACDFWDKGISWRTVEKAVHRSLGGCFSRLGELEFNVTDGVVTWGRVNDRADTDGLLAA